MSAQPSPRPEGQLLSFSASKIESLDRSRVNWKADKQRLRDLLGAVWSARDKRLLRMEFTVYTWRLLQQLGREFDRAGWRLCIQTELNNKTVTIRIVQKFRGNRPSRLR